MGIWKPLNDVVIIEPDPIEKYVGLIQLPEKNSEEKISPWATVVRVGPECKEPIRPGTRILFDRFFDKPQYIYEGDKRYRLIKEHYIHAIVE